FLGIPLNCPGRCRSVLYLGRPVGGPAFSASDVAAVQAIGRFLEEGSLIEEARLLARVRLLTQVAQAAAGNLDLAPFLRVAVRQLARLWPMQVCAVWLVEFGTTPASEHLPQSSEVGVKPRFPSPFADHPTPMLPFPDDFSRLFASADLSAEP